MIRTRYGKDLIHPWDVAMRYHSELLDELNLLQNFSLDTTQQGIKVHQDAEPAIIAAAQRLYEKGLITLADGGYLTDQGRDASEHSQALLTLLREPISSESTFSV